MIKALFTTAILAVAVQSCFAKDEFKPLADYIEQTKEISGLPSGTAVALIKDGKIIYQGNFGYSDISEGKKVNKNTSFYVASTTKPFYAMSTLVDINNGHLKATDTLAKLFPKGSMLQLSDAIMNQVTVKDLLVHSSGIGNEDLGWAVAYTGLHDLAARKAMLYEETIPLKEMKYGEFDYTNFGYNLLSVWADEHYKMPWQEKIQQNVYTPLNMKHTTSIISKTEGEGWDLAKPYSYVNDNKTEALYLSKVDSTMHSAGGMVTSATDMAQMVLAQLNNGVLNGEQVLPASIIKQSQTTQVDTDGGYAGFSRTGYAWGWFTGEYRQQKALHHHGGFAGTHAMISFMPEKKIGVIILNNEDFISRRMTEVASDIAYGILLEQTDGAAESKAGIEKMSELAAKFPEMMAAHKTKLMSREWKLTKPKADYTGVYQHPHLGDIKVVLDKEGVYQYSWGQLKTSALAFTKEDSMRVEFSMFNGNMVKFNKHEEKIVSFDYDGNTFIKKL